MTVLPPRPRRGEGQNRPPHRKAHSPGFYVSAELLERQAQRAGVEIVYARGWGPGVSPSSAARAVQPADAVAAGGSKQDKLTHRPASRQRYWGHRSAVGVYLPRRCGRR
jgi:hypothetical protein